MFSKPISFAVSALFLAASFLVAQHPQAVPHLVRYSSSLGPSQVNKVPVDVEFALYAVQSGGDAMWKEHQTVSPDDSGRFTVMLGAATPDGLPDSIFRSGEARWVGISVDGQEQPRTPLAAAAYSLKTQDAETLGGHPASDFALLADKSPAASSGTAVTQINTSNGVLGGGTGPTVSLQLDSGYLQTLGNSLYAQKNAVVSSLTGSSGVIVSNSGTAYSASVDPNYLVGLGNTVYPQLGVSNTYRGSQTLAANGTATSATAYNSYAQRFAASAYNSSVGAPVSYTYGWQAEPAANNTASAAATLNLLYSAGSNAPAETGLAIAPNGVITFAAPQTFPGTSALAGNNTFTGSNTFSKPITFASSQTFPGTGTITGVTAGADLTGGGTSGAVTLNLNTAALQKSNDARYGELSANNAWTGSNSFANSTSFSGEVVSSGISTFTGSVGMENSLVIDPATTTPEYAALYVYGDSPAFIASNDGGTGLDITSGSQFSDESDSYIGTAAIVTDAGSSGNGYGALLATATANYAGYFASFGGYSTMLVKNDSTAAGQIGIEVRNTNGNAFCRTFLGAGTQENISCTGTFNGNQTADSGRVHELYVPQNTENWTEDYGTGSLVNGRAVVTLDSEYAGMVAQDTSYHVFLTPNDDCQGLYITHKTPTSFEVREMRGGNASLDFDYKIVAHRRGMENIRMRDITEEQEARKRTFEESEHAHNLGTRPRLARRLRSAAMTESETIKPASQPVR